MNGAHPVDAGRDPTTTHGLRVAAYNVCELAGDVDAAAALTRAVAPDVLCLQEAPRRPWSRQRLAGYAAACGMVVASAGPRSGGTAVLVATSACADAPVLRPLPTALGQRSRGYAAARVVVGALPAVSVVSIHLGLDAGIRYRHAGMIVREIEALAELGPVIVAGDLNEGVGGAAAQALLSRLTDLGPSAASFPAHRPRHRIDLILGAGLVGGPTGVGAAVGLPPGLLVAASDHLPVWAEVSVAPV